MARDLSDLGEFGLIERIQRLCRPKGKNILLGIGDDAAAFLLSRNRIGLATTDTLVDGVHFDCLLHSYGDIGWRAMAANLSDIAAMGGEPLLALISLTLTRGQRLKDVDELYAGMKKLADRYRLAIAGGDIVKGREFSINITVIGQGDKGNLGLRSGARPGDAVMVTGTLGGSAAALELLKSGIEFRDAKLVRKHLRPSPRVGEAINLSRRIRLHGMIDISDGLSSELWHLARQSRVGIVVDQGALPVAPEALAIADLLGRDPLEYCLHGGEEYELLFTCSPDEISRARAAIKCLGTACVVIGQVVPGRGVWLWDAQGRRQLLGDRGYKHHLP